MWSFRARLASCMRREMEASSSILARRGSSGLTPLNGRRRRLHRRYSDVGPGSLFASAGAPGLLAIAERDRAAARARKIARGDEISLVTP